MGGNSWTQHTWYSQYTKNSYNSSSKKKKKKKERKKENNQKWAEDVNIYFPQIDIRMANRQKKMFHITNRQGIKTTVRCHFIPFRMAIIKKTNNRCWWGYREKGTFMQCGVINWCIQYGKLYGGSSQNENCHMIQQFHIWGFTWKKLKTLMWKVCVPLC